jgi:Fe2+ or Zn2+ uptake regulation protein
MLQDIVKSNTSTPAEPRLAKNYRLVNEILREQGPGMHMSVADVHALAQKRRPGIGFTTVYRALARLRTLGLVSEILLPGADSAFYEPAASPHAHFRCEVCGTVHDINYVLSQRTVDELARKHDADVTDVSLTLHGRCANCKDRGA